MFWLNGSNGYASHLATSDTERQASGAGKSRSEARAEAVSRRLQALVGPALALRDALGPGLVHLLPRPSARPHNVVCPAHPSRTWRALPMPPAL
jgi:hypothetical protein